MVFDPEQGVEANAVVTLSSRGRVRCEVGEVSRATCVPDVAAWLLLGVCKGDRFEWALREATALGVTEIVPVWMARSASAGTRADGKRMERWRRILVEGARQSGRGDIPGLTEPMGLEGVGELLPEDLTRVCLWEGAREPAGPWLSKGAGGLALMVGPEGGMEVEEVDCARALGFAVVSLGSTILRTETAVVVALGAWRLGRSSG
jgi:16S rRNA (uracil1498-N3)-methyltransferase